jgi:hypothetical protein
MQYINEKIIESELGGAISVVESTLTDQSHVYCVVIGLGAHVKRLNCMSKSDALALFEVILEKTTSIE